ncbi:hypothetical protein NXS19_011706 [Fusarium pseudograminearum]|uniref:Uncharacterized protein n=1 Tax=Fusarium pseudograminearum (strain CS3096) TaxID=1028729 RepID=K3VAE4_FUSPC|nr:hypothetical protein FPSE_09087 [Fusarium pseudograminearum CS3096]EKJ70717.1 hypothetical protein FPSE_09087 [Fusarium pseudograminearum CS3096]KAF0641906.1 hypothetical protein FPSE5266_09087 [Fusarium pseudograminearum]UZP43894.1 hypothetical protein NXS19_011706 [Fusarium pseudograminearum]
MMWISISPASQSRQNLMVLSLLLCFVHFTVQQRDPISNFCRRWGHHSAVVDEKLYIGGGLVTYDGSSGTPPNVSNPYFLYHDLRTAAGTGMPQPYANLSKNSTIPDVSGGIFWPDTINKKIYLFGGEYNDVTPWDFDLYAYDIINDEWDNLGVSRTDNIVGLSYGAGVSIPDRGEAYYYGGWMNNATVADWGDAPQVPTSYLVRYEMDTNSWSNDTGPDDIGRAEGVMVHIPAGDGGMLVYLGGIRATDDGGWEGQPMEQIILYDVLSGKSYFQNATGDVPEPRRRFCAGATWVEDQSSYNIYLYGGAGQEEGSAGFDDIYILTLPTFEWIKMYPNENGTGSYPHHSMTCNVVNEAQMFVHGGFFPLNDDCDVPDQWGLHDVSLGRQNKNKSPWMLYDPELTKYAVPTDVVSVVGGNPKGGATKTAPAGGFDHQDLNALMTRTASAGTRTATRNVSGPTATGNPESGSKLPTGAIVGIAVGGAVVLIGVVLASFCLIRKRRARPERIGSQQPMDQDYNYHHPTHPSIISNQCSSGPWSPQSSSFNPSSPFASPQAARSYTGPPVELPSGNMEDTTRGSPLTQTVTTTLEPKYDAHGNLWVPQVSTVQIPDQLHSPGSPPYYDGTMGSNWTNSSKNGTGYFASDTPQELAAERHTSSGSGQPTHQTYYHP